MKNSFIRATALGNVSGRINYISNPKKQESLMAFHDPMPEGFWRRLGKHCQKQGNLFNPDKKVCEGRELIVMLPYEFENIKPRVLAQKLAFDFEEKHGVPCAVAIHWNKSKSNYHAHIIFSECPLKVKYGSVATRNTYFDQQGKRSTKEKCTDSKGELLPGCRLVAKGQQLSEDTVYGAKKNFARYDWLLEEKKRLTRFFNRYLKTEKWQVYDRDVDYHLATMHIGKEMPEGLTAWKIRENKRIEEYNAAIDELISSGEISQNQAIGLKFKVLRERKAAREIRMAERERYASEREARKEAWLAERKWHRELRSKSTVELLVVLAMTLAGSDISNAKFSDKKINALKVVEDTKLQKQIDDIYIALGKIPPSQKSKSNGKIRSTLDDIIAKADARRSERTGKTEEKSQDERD